MHVSKKNLIALIMMDVAILLIAVGVLVFRYLTITDPAGAGALFGSSAALARTQLSASTQETSPATRPATKTEKSAAIKVRNIGFTYFNSKCKSVDVIGDFNNWTPIPMLKVTPKQWVLTAQLAPGEYAYNYVVDGRPIPDPNNPKVCDVGRGYTNSFLKVQPRKER